MWFLAQIEKILISPAQQTFTHTKSQRKRHYYWRSLIKSTRGGGRDENSLEQRLFGVHRIIKKGRERAGVQSPGPKENQTLQSLDEQALKPKLRQN